MNDLTPHEERVAIHGEANVEQATLNLIKRLTGELRHKKLARKDSRDHLNNLLMDDADYEEAHLGARAAAQRKKEAKIQVLNKNTDAAKVDEQIREFNEDIKMIEDSLNTHVASYVSMTGSQTIEDDGFELFVSPRYRMKVKQLSLFE